MKGSEKMMLVDWYLSDTISLSKKTNMIHLCNSRYWKCFKKLQSGTCVCVDDADNNNNYENDNDNNNDDDN